ncbi:methyl-accepting chemotaxis (MCP) signaling domain protein [Paraburkholderia xenovorans LB400]|uniref:Methyl-accepting chemotaxis sensory transducer n=1 Tax=Paraburkholderia xenovorans (strain LB400) TaxID=266265 RepID=Q13G55_PARXL|nr:methyl-accepting chemotaxis protein [Paraburkholderia xenovorans]ABE36934.1 methyl-accepting chemotaxis sensory transducer [Paraburkholderia xenovorans LB400]AIP35067.1 methyl-accepting chemotaxis (MCP) signaling domain protein [Paraburkholderia xenovorans LB400]
MNVLRRLSVRQKLILAMSLSILIFVVISAALSVVLTGNRLKQRAVSVELPAAVGEIRNDVLRQIGGPLALTRGMAVNTFMLDWEAKGLPDDGTDAWKRYAQSLKSAAHAATISWVSEDTGKYLNETGVSRTVSKSDPGDQWFYGFLSGAKAYELDLDKDKASSEYNLFINARFDAGGKTGVASLGFSVSQLAESIRNYRIGEHGFVYLVRPDGAYVIHRDAALADGQHYLKDAPGFDAHIVSALLNGQKFTSASYSANDGRRLVAASYMPELNLYVVAEVPEAEVLGDITQTATISALVAALIGGGVGLLIIVLVSQTIAGPLGRAAAMLSEIADGNGDLTRRLKVESDDEVGRLSHSFNRFVESLNHIIGDVRASTVAISSASREIAAGNLDLSARTEAQASSLEETAAAMEQLTATVQQNANHAGAAHELVIVASDRAQRGGHVVGDVVRTMSEITESSRKIADIIAVIDGIAFQTNILALNAAVEAARAGEQGRGFAVVASEVRSLAQRSASAAKEIKALIDSSAQSVADGSQRVASAQASMTEIVAAVQSMTGIMNEIASASTEQSVGIGEVNQAVVQIDENTQRNAAQVEEAAAAAKSMEEQAAALARIVAMFRIDERLAAADRAAGWD